MALDAVIFDLDGTLTDTEEVWDEVRRGLAAEAGIPWGPDDTRAMMGMSTQEWSHYLTESVGLPMTPEEAARATVQGMATKYLEGIQLMPGAVEAVKRMAERYPIAIVSSSPRLLIETATEVMGVADLLRATVSTEEVDRGKPAPDGYLRACELLGVRPGHTLAVEDTHNGILSALNAGLEVVAVPGRFHPPGPQILERTTVIPNLDELTYELVESLF
ncbi:HAD family hydrolase [Tessaracoccus oleiagri]|uniref:Haloacid dehalogenase superfamily, subfamily IA, variant 3 with third motif having DD or ED n=1 Tax=Tessaracoccus oleiagri TaxID=686624 RepID=A0A1G9J6G9_9ACTN|nr:HAD family phosphatase [Tessaracoccus oleiagri]SDL33109.1 haloacid dehalogenase superfamily, subfamily IA, variant 3 with third motif having DD or ED [Tessaracoccus oleiagri]